MHVLAENSPTSAACFERVVSIDIDGDGKSDCLIVETDGENHVLKLRVSSSGAWSVLNRYSHSDETIQRIRLSGYRNPKFPGKRTGFAIRLAFPEKSSVLYYWDKRKLKITEFWESD